MYKSKLFHVTSLIKAICCNWFHSIMHVCCKYLIFIINLGMEPTNTCWSNKINCWLYFEYVLNFLNLLSKTMDVQNNHSGFPNKSKSTCLQKLLCHFWPQWHQAPRWNSWIVEADLRYWVLKSGPLFKLLSR